MNVRRQIGVGAAGIVALSILPVVGLIAPLLGGGLAGRHTDESPQRGAVAGAGAGAVASLVGLPLALAAGVAAAATAWPLAAAVFAGTVTLALYNTGLGALGGYAAHLLATTEPPETDGAVDRLREEYLADAVDEGEFERRLERALRDDSEGSETESPADATRPGDTETTGSRLSERL